MEHVSLQPLPSWALCHCGLGPQVEKEEQEFVFIAGVGGGGVSQEQHVCVCTLAMDAQQGNFLLVSIRWYRRRWKWVRNKVEVSKLMEESSNHLGWKSALTNQKTLKTHFHFSRPV